MNTKEPSNINKQIHTLSNKERTYIRKEEQKWEKDNIIQESKKGEAKVGDVNLNVTN